MFNEKPVKPGWDKPAKRHFQDMLRQFSRNFAAVLKSPSKDTTSNMIILIVGIVLALVLRASLIDFKSLDYLHCTKIWFLTIKEGGFEALAGNFSNYNPPYLYLLYLTARFFPDMQPLPATKLPSILSDFLCAGLAFLIVRTRYKKGPLALIAFLAILFAPTVVLNSAFWGQADSIYTAALLACLYFLMTKKPGWACLAFGAALSFKLQAIFFAPLLLVLFLNGSIPWKYSLIIPAVFLLSLVPAWIAGRAWPDLLSIYFSQAEQNEYLTLNAPSLYAWLPGAKKVYLTFYPAGIVLGACAAFMFSAVLYKSKKTWDQGTLIQAALAVMVLVPFVLPKMHERYFFPADVIAIIYIFFFPKYFWAAILINLASFFAYQPFLFQETPISMANLAFANFAGLLIIMKNLIQTFYGKEGTGHEPACQPALQKELE